MSQPKDRALKAKATLKAKAKEYQDQAIRINEDWSVIRIDDLNWQIKYTGKSERIKKLGTDRWYFGSVRGALVGVFQVALNEDPKKFLMGDGEGIVGLAERIQGCLDRL